MNHFLQGIKEGSVQKTTSSKPIEVYWSIFRKFFKKMFESPEKIFVSLASFFGVIMILLLPLFKAPDEMAHFHRAYQVSQGGIVSQNKDDKTGGVVPVIDEKRFFDKLTSADYKFVEFPSSALYSPISYIPQAVGIGIGKLFHPSVGVMVLFGRLFNLIAFVGMVWASIKIAKLGKWVYVVAGLFPMAIHQAASLSSDVITIGIAFLSIACLLTLFTQKRRLTRKQYVITLILALAIGLTKQTNIIFLLPILFLPRSLFGSLWRKAGFIVSVGGAALLTLVGWYLLVRLLHYDLSFATASGVDQDLQLKHLVSQPLSFFEVLVRTYFIEGKNGVATADFFVVSAVGFFSWITYKLPLVLVITNYILLIMAFLYRGREEKADKLAVLSWSFSLTFLMSLITIAGALYLAWTPVAATQVSGIQGRYFIPLIPLLIPFFIVISRYIKLSFDKMYRFGMVVSIITTINLATMVILTYKWFF